MNVSTISRRRLLQGGAALAGSLVIGLRGVEASSAAPESSALSDAFLAVLPDGTVTMQMFQAEMGQGVYTVLAKAVAEELDVDLSAVRTVFAPVDPVYRNRFLGTQGTAVSSTIRLFAAPLRTAAAQARAMLVAAAAEGWNTAPDALVTEGGRVRDPSSGRSWPYGDLVAKAARLPRPTNIALKDPSRWRYLGQTTPRLDTPAKVDGSAIYGIDVKVPGMVHAAIRHAPAFGTRIAALDAATLRGRPGVLDVVNLGDAFAVVADHWWVANRALDDVVVTFTPASSDSDDRVFAVDLMNSLDRPLPAARRDGDVQAALGAAAVVREATFQVPPLAHLAMEPMNCTAQVTADGVEVWTGVQFQELARTTAARVAGVPEEKVRIHNQFLGGGFGRRCETDVVAQAVAVAKAVGRPVKLIWSREEDVQHDFYRPINVGRITAGLDAEGRIVAWRNAVAGPSILSRMFPHRVKDGIDLTSLQGAIDLPYQVPNLEVSYGLQNGTIPFGWWRSVGHSFNSFFIETFIDELAEAARQDPLAFRRNHLAHDARAVAVLEEIARQTEWSSQCAPGRSLGLAFGHGYGSYGALAAEVTTVSGEPKVERLTAVADCGVALDPGAVKAQMESALIFGLSAALWDA
jgi:isoquinoline 1-oxidoreductase beta subunit